MVSWVLSSPVPRVKGPVWSRCFLHPSKKYHPNKVSITPKPITMEESIF